MPATDMHDLSPCRITAAPSCRNGALRLVLLSGASALALAGVVLPSAAQAQDRTISTTGSSTVYGNNGAIAVTGSGTISGGGIYSNAPNQNITTLSNAGFIADLYNGRSVTGGTIGTLTNTGTIGYAGIQGANLGIFSQGSINTLQNLAGGTIQGWNNAIFLSNPATIGLLSNAGTISGHTSAIQNGAVVGTLTNTGVISAYGYGVANNGGTINSLVNGVGGTISTTRYEGVRDYAGGVIGSLTNSGVIHGGATGVGVWSPNSSIGALTNNGTISGRTGVLNYAGTVGGITNSGVITGSASGIQNWGRMGTITNTGTISHGALIAVAINSGGGTNQGVAETIGAITNSGVINGSIIIGGQNATISGGSGATFGTLTGGQISVSNGNVTFAGGNTQLNDNVNVQSGGKVTNAGTLQITAANKISIYSGGGFAQTATGVLSIQASSATTYGGLFVTGAAGLGGGLDFELASGFTLAKGDAFTLMNFASVTGNFSNLSLDGTACSTGGGNSWNCGGWAVSEVLTKTTLALDITGGSSSNAGIGNSVGAATPVPEPATPGLFAIALAALGWVRRRA
jgi:hypothetical protein